MKKNAQRTYLKLRISVLNSSVNSPYYFDFCLRVQFKVRILMRMPIELTKKSQDMIFAASPSYMAYPMTSLLELAIANATIVPTNRMTITSRALIRRINTY